MMLGNPVDKCREVSLLTRGDAADDNSMSADRDRAGAAMCDKSLEFKTCRTQECKASPASHQGRCGRRNSAGSADDTAVQ